MSKFLSVYTLANGKKVAELYTPVTNANGETVWHLEDRVTDSRRMHRRYMELVEKYS